MSRLTHWINEVLRKTVKIEIKKYKKDNYIWLKQLGINTVIDIGANEGQFAKKIAELLPNVKIISFEPIKTCFERLKVNTRRLNIDCYQYALGETEGEADIHLYNHSPSSSMLKMKELHEVIYPHSVGYVTEKIEIRTLDEVIDKNLKNNILIKIDVQGFEDKVIRGGEGTIAKAKVVLIEMTYAELYEGQCLFDEIYSQLNRMGFSFRGNMAQATNPMDGSILYSDSIFIKNS